MLGVHWPAPTLRHLGDHQIDLHITQCHNCTAMAGTDRGLGACPAALGCMPSGIQARAPTGTPSRFKQQPGVALKVEMATKMQAQLMQWAAWVLLLLISLLSIALVAARSDIKSEGSGPKSIGYHKGALTIASTALAAQLGLAAGFAYRVLRTFRRKLVWSRRHIALVVDAAVVQGLQIVNTIFWVAPNAAVVGASCFWPYNEVAAFAMVRDSFFITLMMWMLMVMHSLGRYRPAGKKTASLAPPSPALVSASLGSGKGQALAEGSQRSADTKVAATGAGAGSSHAAPPAANAAGEKAAAAEAVAAAAGQLLIIDRPWGELLRIHKWKLLTWVVLEVLVVLDGVKQISWDGSIPLSEACAAAVADQTPADRAFSPSSDCGLGGVARAGMLIQAIVIIAYFTAYIIYQRRAFRDHASLPYMRYRMTNLFIRVQARHGTVVLAAVTVTVLVTRVASTAGSCWSFLENDLGALPVQLALCMLAMAAGVLYMPSGGAGATMLQTWLQEFAWAECALPAALARRTEELQQFAEAEGHSQAVALLRHLAPFIVRSRLSAMQDAEAELAQEPMLCMETTLRLFYWMRLAYQITEESSLVKEGTALSLFGLHSSEVLLEPSTETQAVLGWGGPGCTRVVLSFRGTANLQNAITDAKFWKTNHLPKRRWRGRLVQVHSGFYHAWLGGGFSERLLGRLKDVVEGLRVDPSQLTFLVTGHSLGGALATLAAFEVQQKWQQARVRVYTFGAPRVGNSAWAGEYDKAVPDTWQLINHQDPVPRIPKGLYKRTGQRVTINAAGDIIVRPSYFELAMINKSGGTVKDHMTGVYGLALAAILKAQFSPAKSLLGGEEGVCQLAANIDIGQALVLENMDLASLRDPSVQPVPLGAKDASIQKKRTRSGRLSCCGGASGEAGEAEAVSVAATAAAQGGTCEVGEAEAAAAAVAVQGEDVEGAEAAHGDAVAAAAAAQGIPVPDGKDGHAAARSTPASYEAEGAEAAASPAGLAEPAAGGGGGQ